MADKIITDISYTNKDFQSIYVELLDLVKKLSNKWDPSLSNESDPGVLLLKLNAIIADKNNYNIDKNILECFPASVTQLGNARKLYDLLGYKMNYFKSAEMNIYLQLKNIVGLDTNGEIVIPQFTQISDNTGEIIYTTKQEITLSKENLNKSISVPVIEGRIQDYEINGNKEITLNNLDNDLRLYFKDTQIAQNGIYIKNINSTDDNSVFNDTWKLVDNLVSYPLHNKVYEFGILPNSNTCYIQFPEDITELIEQGLKIKYIITSGELGNIKSNTLNTFVEDIASKDKENNIVINDLVKITQPKESINGANPEGIAEAFNNYKKTIGTFNTLVTRRDYERYIYNAKVNNKNIVSNVVVSDRTNDINSTNYIQVKDGLLKNKRNLTIKNNKLNAYNIVLYLLNNPITLSKDTYDSTFTNDTTAKIAYVQDENFKNIKSVQHDILAPQGEKFIITNLYPLKGSLITYNKVTTEEKENIESNVKLALIKAFNSHELTFGNELEYETIINVIQNADARIKTIIIDPPTCNPKLIKTNNEEEDLYSNNGNNDFNNELIARMILSGKLQLFKFNDDFAIDFGQQEGFIPHSSENKDNIKNISTEAEISLNSQDYRIKTNESIQILEPNLVTTEEYSNFVKYIFKTSKYIQLSEDITINSLSYLAVGSKIKLGSKINGQVLKEDKVLEVKVDLLNGDIIKNQSQIAYPSKLNDNEYFDELPINQDYKLKQGEKLILNYQNTDGQEEIVTIQEDNIINTNVLIKTNEQSKALLSGQYIRKRALNKATLPEETKYYFITNNIKSENNIDYMYLTIPENGNYILQENEYFIYTNPNSDALILLGSGTKLSNTSVDSQGNPKQFQASLPIRDIEDITEEEIENIQWLQLKPNENITTEELIITSLNEGSIIKLDNTSDTITLNNEPIKLNYNILYKINDTQTSYIPKNISLIGDTLIQSRLRLNANNKKPQTLYDNHKVILTFIDEQEKEIKPQSKEKLNILFNNPLVLSGGTKIDTKVLKNDTYEYSLKAFVYKPGSISSTEPKLERNKNNLLDLTLDGVNTKWNLNYSFTTRSKFKSYIIPLEVTFKTSNNNLTLKTKLDQKGNSTEALKLYNSEITLINNSGTYLFEVPYDKDTFDIIIETTSPMTDKETIKIGNIILLDGLNNELNSKDILHNYDINTNIEKVLKQMKIIDPNNTFNWVYKVAPEDKVIEPVKASSYWNLNHIYNKFIIPKIDFNNYDVTVHASSIVKGV